MKNFLLLRLQFAALAVAGAVLPVRDANAQTPPPSPLGTWDLSISGNQIGLARLTFDADFTYHGFQFMRPGPVPSSSTAQPADPRFPGGEPTRGGVIPPPAPTTPPTNFIGGTTMSGTWAFDDKGKILGILDQITESVQLVERTVTNTTVTSSLVNGVPVITTNEVVGTTNVFELVKATNAVSIRASVVTGKKLSLNAYLPKGRNIYTGTPVIALPDLSGDYFSTGKRGSVPIVEFLTLEPSFEFPGLYAVSGFGAGYGFQGWALPSRRNQIAVYMQTDREPYPITVHTGAFNNTTRRGSLYGRDTSGNRYTYRFIHQ